VARVASAINTFQSIIKYNIIIIIIIMPFARKYPGRKTYNTPPNSAEDMSEWS
jgi:hypothetical protein